MPGKNRDSANPDNESRSQRVRLRQAVNLGERLLALALALLLLRSAFAHLGNPYYFLSTVYSYQVTSIGVGKWFALVLPYLQLLMAICLLARWWVPAAYLIITGMFLAFLVAQLLVLHKGLEISCGCFGASNSLRIGPATLTVAALAVCCALSGLGLHVIRERSLRRVGLAESST